MESIPTDEVLCSNCGRPNLKEAVKCWYCQTILSKSAEDETKDELQESQRNEPDRDLTKKVDHTQSGDEKDIPEWLHRIRELKKADQQTEEEKNHWQQQAFFGAAESKRSSQPRKKENIQQPQKKQEKVKNLPEEPLQPHMEIEKPSPAKTINELQPEGEEEQIDSGTDELPEGFIRFKQEDD